MTAADSRLPTDAEHAARTAGGANGQPASCDTLPAALARHHIELPPDQVEDLDRYCRLLWDWNRKLNLTRHTTYEKFVTRDVVDARRLADLLEPGEKVLDVGTGGGLPGVVIAILRPDVDVTLCESVAKKARAAAEIVRGLGWSLPVLHARAESLLAEQTFDTLVIRAVAPLPKLLTWFRPHVTQFGRMLIVKGASWVAERAAARQRRLLVGLHLRLADAYATPTESGNAQSVILWITPEHG